MRLLSNTRNRARNRESKPHPCDGPLVPSEIEEAECYWFMTAQREREIGDWKTHFSDLTLFIEEGVVRVGGRLENATLTYGKIHQYCY